MPNWCLNRLTITGPPSDLGEFIARAWGCKWGGCDCEMIHNCDGQVQYRFLTAWSPPVPFLVAASKRFTNLAFLLEYEELGNCLSGFMGIESGKLQGFGKKPLPLPGPVHDESPPPSPGWVGADGGPPLERFLKFLREQDTTASPADPRRPGDSNA